MLHSVQVLTTQSNRPSSNGSSSAVCTRRSTSIRLPLIRSRAMRDIPTPGSTAVRRWTLFCVMLQVQPGPEPNLQDFPVHLGESLFAEVSQAGIPHGPIAQPGED